MNKNVPLEQLVPVPVALLRVGEALPYDLYNDKGKFLSAKNYVFKSEIEVAMVSNAKPMRLRMADDAIEQTDTNRSSFVTAGKSSTPKTGEAVVTNEALATNNSNEHEFTAIKGARELIAIFPNLYRAFHADKDLARGLLAKVEKILMQVISDDLDAVIGAIHMTEIKSQAEHCVFCAILAAIYSRTIGYPNRFVRLVATSAFCMNLGAIKLHHQLNSKDSALTDDMRLEIRQHSQATVNLIASVGLRHPTIINAILHHHERPDGNGYPSGLQSGEIPDEALIIGIVDTYLAMIGPRAYREKIQPKEALKAVLFEGHKYDNEFYTFFIKAIGVFPAGTFHALSNDDVVVVTRRNPAHSTKPEVCTLMNANGVEVKALNVIRLADTSLTIKAPYTSGNSFNIKPEDLWG
jgi:HD-GYP domain-containing protein (c-di-GMP phosphodiesterase class II)